MHQYSAVQCMCVCVPVHMCVLAPMNVHAFAYVCEHVNACSCICRYRGMLCICMFMRSSDGHLGCHSSGVVHVFVERGLSLSWNPHRILGWGGQGDPLILLSLPIQAGITNTYHHSQPHLLEWKDWLSPPEYKGSKLPSGGQIFWLQLYRLYHTHILLRTGQWGQHVLRQWEWQRSQPGSERLLLGVRYK